MVSSQTTNEGNLSQANGEAVDGSNVNDVLKNESGSPVVDPTEMSLGISTYMNPSIPGFSAVLKGRYSDFVVHEVDWNGMVARLTSQTLLNDASNSNSANKEDTDTKREDEMSGKDGTGGAGNCADKTESQSDTARNNLDLKRKHEDDGFDWQALESQLSKKIDDETVARTVMSMLQLHESSDSTESVEEGSKFVSLPSLTDKQTRKAIHEWVRSTLTCARSDTMDGAIRIWHRKFEKEMPNYKAFGNTHKVKKKRKLDWPKDRPNFLKFVLYKENIDTTTATRELSRKGGMKARIGYAGMKDKRGITSQFCTLYRTQPEQILSLTRSVGGGNTKDKGHSVVQVGNFEYVSNELRLGMLNGNRFDVVLRNVITAAAGDDDATKKQQLRAAAEALKSNGFVNYFGTQRFGKFNDTHLVGVAVFQGNYRKAIDIIMQPKPDERPDIQRAREDWENRFANKDGSVNSAESPDREADCARRVMKSLNRFMTAEFAILQSLSRRPRDYRLAFSCIPRTLRMMFLHAVQSLVWNQSVSYRLDSMSRSSVLVGDLVDISPCDGSKGSSTPKIHVVTEDDISQGRFSLSDVVLPLIGKKSLYPTNEAGTAIDKYLKEHEISKEMISKFDDRELRLIGDYRKMICQPTDFDFEIVEYHDPLQPLLQTDLMKLNGEDIEILPNPSKQGSEKSENAEGNGPLIAMIVGFTLPSSSYATIALRELMKTPTSSEYQKSLKLDD